MGLYGLGFFSNVQWIRVSLSEMDFIVFILWTPFPAFPPPPIGLVNIGSVWIELIVTETKN